MWYGSPTTCTFAPGNWNSQYLTCTQSIPLPATTGTLELRFSSYSAGEDNGFWDSRFPQVSGDNGVTWKSLPAVLSSDRWLRERFDMSEFAGQTVRVRFMFSILDGTLNDHLGWLIDDVQVVEQSGPAVENCFGDGTWYACPCNNAGGAGRGCASSFHAAGARLSASGSASLGNDTLAFSADGLSNATVTIFQGANFGHVASTPAVGGDGLACLASPFVRVRNLSASGGTIAYPSVGDPKISVLGAISVPWTTRYYAVRYRNAVSFCTTAAFNLTNTLQVTWRP